MAGQLNEQGVVAVEIERVRPALPVLFDRDDVFYSTVEKKEVEVVSKKQMRVPLKIRPGGRSGSYNPDGGSLGRGGSPSYEKAVVDTVNMKHALEWTYLSQIATDDKRKAVLNTFRDLLSTAMAEFRRFVDSMCMTAGDGVVGTVSGVSTSGGKDTLTLNTDGFGARLVRYDQMLNVFNAALSTRRVHVGGASANGEAPVDLYDLANKQIRLNGSTGATTATDKIVIEGLRSASPVHMQGVPYHHSNSSTGTWLGIDRAANPEIRANRVDASGTLALPFARLAMNKIGDRVGKEVKKKCKAWMHPAQQQAYEELGQLVQVMNRTPGTNEPGLDLYYGDNMQMAGCPVSTSFSWDKKRIDFINSEVWGRAELDPIDFYKAEGRRIFEVRGVDGGVDTSFLFYLVASFNMYIDNPAAASYIDNLTVPSGY